jgi:hypothetical protein
MVFSADPLNANPIRKLVVKAIMSNFVMVDCGKKLMISAFLVVMQDRAKHRNVPMVTSAASEITLHFV